MTTNAKELARENSVNLTRTNKGSSLLDFWASVQRDQLTHIKKKIDKSASTRVNKMEIFTIKDSEQDQKKDTEPDIEPDLDSDERRDKDELDKEVFIPPEELTDGPNYDARKNRLLLMKAEADFERRQKK